MNGYWFAVNALAPYRLLIGKLDIKGLLNGGKWRILGPYRLVCARGLLVGKQALCENSKIAEATAVHAEVVTCEQLPVRLPIGFKDLSPLLFVEQH